MAQALGGHEIHSLSVIIVHSVPLLHFLLTPLGLGFVISNQRACKLLTQSRYRELYSLRLQMTSLHRTPGASYARTAILNSLPSSLHLRDPTRLSSVRKAHNAAIRRALIKSHFVLYDLRHTFATRAVAAGVDLPTLSAMLGHTSITMTMRYVHPAAEQKRLAAAKLETFRVNGLIVGCK